MAATSGYDTSVRQYLTGKGVSNSDIGYNPQGYVTVKGQNFIKPAKSYGGTSYDTAYNLGNAWNTYQQSLKPTQTQAAVSPVTTSPRVLPTAGSAITTGSNFASTYSKPTASSVTNQGYQNPYDQRVNDIISQLTQQVKQPQQVDLNAIYSSPEYAAYQAQQARNTQAANRQAQEGFGTSGFARSSDLANTLANNQNQENEYMNLQVVPQLIAQQQAEKAAQLQNTINLLNSLTSQQGVYDTRYNNAQDLALQKGQLTGNYVDPAAAALINQILQDKQNYAAATTPEARAQANADANSVRSQLAALGIDPSLFGSNQTLAQAQSNLSKAGTPTLAAQQQAYQVARDKIADEQYKQKFDEDVRQFNLDYALDQAVKNHQMSIDDANLALQKAQEARMAANAANDNALGWANYNRGVLESDRNYNLDLAREGRLAAEDSNSTTDPYKQLNDVAGIIDKSAQYTTDLKTGNKVLSNSDAVEKQILNSGLPEYQMWQLYQRYGLPWQGAIPSPN